jgi:hypothetical protein
MDRGVTLQFRCSFDAKLRRTGLSLDKIFCALAAGGVFSSLSSSETSFAEDGEVNMALYTCKTSEYKI